LASVSEVLINPLRKIISLLEEKLYKREKKH
jgi:hypothetical protein